MSAFNTPSRTASPLSRYGWYHGRVDRATAESLVAKMPVGSFIVRDSSSIPGDFVVSVRDDSVKAGCTHYIVNHLNGRYFAGDVYFNSLPAVIDHYSKHKLGTTVLGSFAQSANTSRPLPAKPELPERSPANDLSPVSEQSLRTSPRKSLIRQRTKSSTSTKLLMGGSESTPDPNPPPLPAERVFNKSLHFDRAASVDLKSTFKSSLESDYFENLHSLPSRSQSRPIPRSTPNSPPSARSQSRPIPRSMPSSPPSAETDEPVYGEVPIGPPASSCPPTKPRRSSQNSTYRRGSIESPSPPSSFGSNSVSSISSNSLHERVWLMDESSQRIAELNAGMSIQEETALAIAIYSRTVNAYDAKALAFEVGDQIIVHEQRPSGTWYGECNGRSGYFPFTAVQLYSQPA